MAIILSLGAALTYGAPDFIGGLMTKRNDVFRVVFLSQLLAVGPLLLAFTLLNDGVFDGDVLAWSSAAGLAGGAGVVLLYSGLAIGQMGVVAPITAVEAALVPVLFGLATGERPGALALVGVVVALLAVGFISSVSQDVAGEEEPRRSGIVEALGAGLAFGTFFIFLDQVGDDSGMWPLLLMRASLFGLVGVGIIVAGVSLRPAAGTFWGIAAAGTLNVAADLFYLLSTREGLLTIVAVVTSMYPAMTVLLARLHLKERFTQVQSLGLALAGAAIVLIATG